MLSSKDELGRKKEMTDREGIYHAGIILSLIT